MARTTIHCAHVVNGARIGSVNDVRDAQVVTCWDCSDAIDAGEPFPLESGHLVRIS